MKECIECHKLIRDEAKFCGFCSTRQPAFTDPDTDPRNMYQIEAQWRPVLDRAEVQTIGVRDIPSQPERIQESGSEWIIKTLNDDEICDIPPKTNQRIQAVEKEGLIIDCWILMEEQIPPVPEPERDYDPILVGVIRTGSNRGVWCVFGRWKHL